jgi:hypothetical protein
MRISSNPPQTNRLWVFDRAKLHNGDVVLELGDGLTSWAISKADGSPFSHALIWAGNTDFVESVGCGVRILSFERIIITDPNRWLLLRQADREIGKRAALAARQMVTKYYNMAGALTSVTEAWGATNEQQLFCSELVAQAYRDAGVDLIPGCQPHKVTPKLLLQSSALSPVDLPLLECDPRSRERAVKFLDRDTAYETSLMAKEARVAREAFAEVATLFETLPPVYGPGLKNPPGNLHELIDLLASIPVEDCRAIMDRLLLSLQVRGYFALLDEPMKEVRETFLSAGMHLRSGNVEPAEREALRKDMLEQCRGYGETAQRHLGNALICEKLNEREMHALWKELAAMHRRNYHKFLMLGAMGTDMSSDAWIKGEPR